MSQTPTGDTPADGTGIDIRDAAQATVTLDWVRNALMGRLVSVALEAGLDPAGWSFGQHAGLSWTLMDAAPGGGLRQLGIWASWQDARHSMEGMIAALAEIVHQRRPD